MKTKPKHVPIGSVPPGSVVAYRIRFDEETRIVVWLVEEPCRVRYVMVKQTDQHGRVRYRVPTKWDRPLLGGCDHRVPVVLLYTRKAAA